MLDNIFSTGLVTIPALDSGAIDTDWVTMHAACLRKLFRASSKRHTQGKRTQRLAKRAWELGLARRQLMLSMTRRLAASSSGAPLCAVFNSSNPIRLHVEELILMQSTPMESGHEVTCINRRPEVDKRDYQVKSDLRAGLLSRNLISASPAHRAAQHESHALSSSDGIAVDAAQAWAEPCEVCQLAAESM